MNKSQRLLALLDLLRRRRHPVTAETLAGRLNVSARTVYRDIADLCTQGADIRGEAGLGFVLRGDFGLPPLMFDEAEIEALVFGMRWAAANADGEMAQHARSSLAKIHAALPPKLRERIDSQSLYPLSRIQTASPVESETLALIRAAMRGNLALSFDYTDAAKNATRRTVWPLAVGYFDDARVLAAWCEMRQDFRHFRTDRIARPATGSAFPAERMVLLRQWLKREGLDLSAFEI
ncbi:HTH domain protein [Neisseria sp. oral taxon 020 str. F0370]|uniref:helix-turn-helix transcriptional regulator n=1 Tax=unclassified Neisseria TaxID=2623750 RepID=UPI0002A21119|nr:MULTISPECIES: YafY family protein [unclassified Neisseria]ASP17814.1 YafY family transcriptional regulator [Neisseria sp. KEM232]EKY10475.1 HTH domain protein [Neisseria sp. oral taxon 020 str. F0370]